MPHCPVTVFVILTLRTCYLCYLGTIHLWFIMGFIETQKEAPTFHCILTQMYLECNPCNQMSSNKQQGELV